MGVPFFVGQGLVIEGHLPFVLVQGGVQLV